MRWLIALALLGCSSSATPERTPVSIFVASSLTDAFQALEAAFEAAHPAVDLRVTTGGSQVLRLQIEHGARADLFISANDEHVGDLIARGRLSQHAPFVRNRLAVLVPDASSIRAFSDLTSAQRMVVGTRQVPIGAYTHAVFERLAPDTRKALNARIVSRESNVRLVRAKVLLGEADAAIGYRTDARIEGVRAVEIPAHLQPFVLYHLGWPSPSTPAAQQVLDFLKGPTGARILTAQGFIP